MGFSGLPINWSFSHWMHTNYLEEIQPWLSFTWHWLCKLAQLRILVHDRPILQSSLHLHNCKCNTIEQGCSFWLILKLLEGKQPRSNYLETWHLQNLIDGWIMAMIMVSFVATEMATNFRIGFELWIVDQCRRNDLKWKCSVSCF